MERLCGILVHDVLQALQDQVHIGTISAVDEVTCDDEASVAKRTRPDSQSMGVVVLARLKRTVRRRASNGAAFDDARQEQSS